MHTVYNILLIIAGFAAGMLISFAIIRLLSRSYETKYIEGLKLKTENKLEKAIVCFKEVIFLNKASNFLTPSSLLAIAEIYSMKGEVEKAIKYAEDAIKNYRQYKYPDQFITQAKKLKNEIERQAKLEIKTATEN